MEEKQIKVTARILGEDYTIRGRASEEHILRVAQFVDEKMLQVAQAYPKLGTSRVAVLSAINLADELFKVREQYEQLTQLLEEEWSQRHAASRQSETPVRTAGGATGARPARTNPLPAPAPTPTPAPAPAAEAEVAATADRTAADRQVQLAAFGEPVTSGNTSTAAGPSADKLFTGDSLTTGTPGNRASRPGASVRLEWEQAEDESQ